jgi:hypothetical protein
MVGSVVLCTVRNDVLGVVVTVAVAEDVSVAVGADVAVVLSVFVGTFDVAVVVLQ